MYYIIQEEIPGNTIDSFFGQDSSAGMPTIQAGTPIAETTPPGIGTTRLSEGRIPTHSRMEQVAEIVGMMLNTLGQAHDRGYYHNDIKSANVIISTKNGKPYLVDWGISESQGLDPAITTVDRLRRANARRVTPGYCTDARLNGEPPSVDDDLYSVGILLTELVFTYNPATAFASKDENERFLLIHRAMIQKRDQSTPEMNAVLLRSIIPSQPDTAVIDILNRNKISSQRFNSAQELSNALDYASLVVADPLLDRHIEAISQPGYINKNIDYYEKNTYPSELRGLFPDMKQSVLSDPSRIGDALVRIRKLIQVPWEPEVADTMTRILIMYAYELTTECLEENSHLTLSQKHLTILAEIFNRSTDRSYALLYQVNEIIVPTLERNPSLIDYYVEQYKSAIGQYHTGEALTHPDYTAYIYQFIRVIRSYSTITNEAPGDELLGVLYQELSGFDTAQIAIPDEAVTQISNTLPSYVIYDNVTSSVASYAHLIHDMYRSFSSTSASDSARMKGHMDDLYNLVTQWPGYIGETSKQQVNHYKNQM